MGTPLSTVAIGSTYGQVAPTDESEIEINQISGIRGSNVASIRKRFATSQVYGIATENIGKLPDTTRANS